MFLFSNRYDENSPLEGKQATPFICCVLNAGCDKPETSGVASQCSSLVYRETRCYDISRP